MRARLRDLERRSSAPPPPPSPRRKGLRWQGGSLEANGFGSDGSEYHVGRNPSTDRFEITFYAADDDRAQFLVEDFPSLEAAKLAAEQHHLTRPVGD